MRSFLSLVAKDIRLEFRSREMVSVLCLLSLILALLASFGVEGAFLKPEIVMRLFPGIFWGSFVVVAAISAGRLFEADFESRAIDAILLQGVSAATVFLAKWVVLATFFLVGGVFQFLMLGVFLNLTLAPIVFPALLIMVAVILPYAALMVTLSALSATSRLRGFLLPVLSLPLTVPLFLGGIELYSVLLLDHQVALSSPWLSLLVIMLFVYGLVGINVFGAVVKE